MNVKMTVTMRLLISIFILLVCMPVFGAYRTELHVAKDGTGDFTSIQAAIDAAKAFPDQHITIYIKNGIYSEKVKVHAWNNRLTLMGESAGGVVLRWGDFFDAMERGRNSTFHTATLLVQGDAFRAENLTIENTAGAVGQAVAVALEADRAVFENCRMIGNQDTLYVDGAHTRQHFINCYIDGTTDFIFGGATAFFENCTIHSKADSYITAASTPEGRAYGFVFRNCRLTAAEGVTQVYLGRPWRNHAKTAFVECELGAHIRPEGWHNWNAKEKEASVVYAEGGNSGPGADTRQRVLWARLLTPDDLHRYVAEEVLKPFALPEMTADRFSRDSSYTLQSAYAKHRKQHPSIRAVEYDVRNGHLLQEHVEYASVNGRSLKLDIFSAAGTADFPKPGIMLIHGGGWSSGDRSLMHPLADYLARQGNISFTVEYRLTPEAPYPAAVHDLQQAIAWIYDHAGDYNLDTNSISVLGCSAGAQLAGLVGLMYGTDHPQTPVHAIINIDGVMDFTSEAVRKTEDDPSRKSTAASRWFGGRYAEIPERWKEASPVYYVNRNSPPILFLNSAQPRFHAGRDEVIEKLNTFSVYSEVHTFEDAPHSFWLFDPWFEKTGKLIVGFLTNESI